MVCGIASAGISDDEEDLSLSSCARAHSSTATFSNPISWRSAVSVSTLCKNLGCLPSGVKRHDDPSFTLALCVKDLRLIGGLESEVGYASDLAAAARARFAEALERFGPETGELAVTRIAETAAATSIRSRR